MDMVVADSAMQRDCSSALRRGAVEFLILSARELQVTPIVKYTALAFFADRFYRLFPWFVSGNGKKSWLLQPIRESNLQLFALVSLWIASKIHLSRPLSVKCLKSFGDKMIKDQHFTIRDFSEGEVIFMKVLSFDISTSNVAFIFIEELYLQFKEMAKSGDLMKLEACMDIMDLLYEKEETSILYSSPCSLAASILVVSYLITIPKQDSEFPILSWVKFVTCCKEEDIAEQVEGILNHIFQVSGLTDHCVL